jgi:hypothetical protein
MPYDAASVRMHGPGGAADGEQTTSEWQFVKVRLDCVRRRADPPSAAPRGAGLSLNVP